MAKYFFKDKLNLILYILFAAGIYACLTAVYQMYSLVTNVIEEMDYASAYRIVFIGIAVLVLLFLLLVVSAVVKQIAVSRIVTSIRSDIFDKVIHMDLHSFGEKDTAWYTSMLVNDVDMLEQSYYNNVFEFAGDCIQLVVMLFCITLIGWRYTLVVLLFAVLSAIQPFILKKRLAAKGSDISEKLAEYTLKTKEYITSYETITGFQAADRFSDLFAAGVDTLENAKGRLRITKMWNHLLVLVAVYVLKAGAQLFFVYHAILGWIAVATVTLLFGLANNVGNPIVALLSYLDPINATRDIRKKVSDFLADNSVLEINGTEKIADRELDIVIQNLSFRYDDSRDIVRNFSATFEQGKKYAIVGESGSGKSTILKLIMGYYNNYEGSIRIGGKELSGLDRTNLRTVVSYISQLPYLFQGSVKSNITLNAADCTEEDIKRAAARSQVLDFADFMTDGRADTMDDGAENLSGGEKQRVTIARALLRNPKIILMDESTSALDNLTAVTVEKELLSDDDITVISIIHRFDETIKMYDCIYYMEQGTICEAGSYDQLMQTDSKLSRLLSAQTEHISFTSQAGRKKP